MNKPLDWNEGILEACRYCWNRPDLTMEELRAKLAAKSDVQFDADNEAEQNGITTAQYLRGN
jgi:hypothetical protein